MCGLAFLAYWPVGFLLCVAIGKAIKYGMGDKS